MFRSDNSVIYSVSVMEPSYFHCHSAPDSVVSHSASVSV